MHVRLIVVMCSAKSLEFLKNKALRHKKKKAKLQAAQAARDFLPDSQDEDRPSDDEESQDEESQDCDGYCFDDCDRCDRRYYGL